MQLIRDSKTIRFAIPKGRMYDGVARLLQEAGLQLSTTGRGYRPALCVEGFEVKILKPRAIVEMLNIGARDLGFAGADWVEETGADLVELIDTGLDQVRLIVAAPESILGENKLPDRSLIVASEYANIASKWVANKNLNATILRSYGATEVLPPENADCIIDNTATGSTLAANGLRIIDELMTSSTRLYASQDAMRCPTKRTRIESNVLLVQSVLEARQRVMLELNVSADKLTSVIDVLPCMREPTVAPMHRAAGFAVKVAILRAQLPEVIPLAKARGGTDIVVTIPEQIVP